MNNLSIYVHWPFCLFKCPYCDFNSHVAQGNNHNIWLKSYERELNYFGEIIKGKYIKSIFFGGGTPSLMEPFVVEGIINKIAKLGSMDSKTEITLEANPTSFEIAKFKNFKSSGINRVSIGVQALKGDSLKKLGREHDVSQAINAIKSAANIFRRVSFDLIYAIPGQTLKEWQEEMIEAIKLQSSGHISLYQLTIEKGTPFYRLHIDGDLIIPDQDLAADMYEWTTDYLESKNYHRYEISNYAIKGQECRHNLAYWNYDEYLGIGPGAHSRIRNFDAVHASALESQELLNNSLSISSIMMWHKPEKWLKSVAEFSHGIQSNKQLNQIEIIEEIFMMSLRLKQGIDIKHLEQLVNTKIFELIDEKKVKHYSDLKLVEFTGDNILLTNKGLMLHNYLVPRLLLR